MGPRVVVLGAGVIGLTSALKLLEQGYDVSIVGRNIPGDLDIHYTSPFAGANWSSFASKSETFLQDLDKPGYLEFIRLSEQESNSAGVIKIPHHKYFTRGDLKKNGGEVTYPWYKNFVQGFRDLEKEELPKVQSNDTDDEIVAGQEYLSVTISTTLYLNYLLQRIFRLGGTLQRKHVSHINDSYNLHHTGLPAQLVINCTGLLSRLLPGVEDPQVFPIRGQILWVRNSASKQISVPIKGFVNESLYIFPRKEGGSIIGGTFQPNDWNSQPDSGLTKRMVSRAKKYLPELVDPSIGNPEEIDIIRENVGLRPARNGGPRIERVGSIIHNYGIAGAGYQASYGLAEIVVKLANEYSNKSKL
ncbi:D-amino acid dehydrogenase small subunit [Wickerhamomyces ciferrii]|uniref:D-amino acid dehydrogenase small subunit n=1 Tax=Wickerhamomyces ciferrii (strain ATCC 14091 / BCRC 22168 / CBS 111 / JCM 3599 / NBRC 0793 / NRRL Y-1031 F-60-10) TaxID=1206466 RepID=K0KS44_WICCF|nr:D-amino acid dehydrogenase small subunit [Wickerhamomyces ciferrii]CCH45986.1 D-amino acid dehydrogenase small subunit [Wickerhamomyces ciferrii]